jgi:lipopolysaccharide biosynthesis glycosyltransferase
MKCYFAFSDDILNNQTYVDMLTVCLKSARKNTTLDLHALYDGKKGDKLYNILDSYGVNIIVATVPFKGDIYKIYTEEYCIKKFGFAISERSLDSRFLRMMLPEFEKTDEIVLYCDTDIMFLKDIKLSDFVALPKYVSCCPEFDKTQDYTYFNAGIMLINVKKGLEKYKKFLKMIANGYLAKIECCDQGYLNDLYKGEFHKLPLEYNWKPYWGINHNAKIIHFHGVKPYRNFINVGLPSINEKWSDIVNGYYYYYGIYASYLGVQKDEIYNSLVKVLLSNIPCETKKINRRIKRLQGVLITLATILLIQIFVVCIILKNLLNP